MALDQYDEAINLLARYAKQNLPDGYTLILSFSRREASLQVEGPDGDDIEGGGACCSPCHRGFVDACDVACEDRKEHLDQEGQP